MTPFASVFQRMLWLVLVSFLSDYKTLPAFHPSEHTQVNEDEKKSSSDIEFMSWVCASDCVYSNAEKAYTWFPVEDLVLSMSVCNVSLCVYCTWFCPCFTFLFTCPRVCTARDFAPAIRPCCLSLCVYYTWFCPCYTFLLPVPVCVLHVILPLLYVPFYLPQGVYCTWFRPCYTSLLPVPVCVLHVILPLLYAPVTCPWVCTARDFAPAIRYCCLSLSVYCAWFCLCYTFLLPVPECVLHVISPLLYVPVACPCVCTARDFVANTHCFDMSLQHEPSFFLVSTKPLWHHLSFFWSILVRAEARFITHDVGECKEVTQQVVNYIKCR